MPTLFNPNRKKGVFMIPSGATKSPTPAPPSFTNTYSLSFDGVDDYVECGTELGNSFGVTTNISISMWINPSVTSGNDLFFNIGSFSNSFGQIAFQLLSNKLYIKLNNGARSYNVAYTNTTDWQHLVFIYDGSNSANTKMYINNVEQSTTIAGVFPSSLDLSNLKTIIGGGYSVSYTYSGLQDEVAIFNTTLTPENVASIYNSGVPNDLTSLNPTAWYRMGDNGSYKSPQWLIPNNINVANSRVSNYSFSLDGVDDYIDCGDSDTFSFGNGSTDSPFSISAWIKLSSMGTTFHILNKENNTTTGDEYVFYIASNTLHFAVCDQNFIADRQGRKTTTLTASEIDNVWCHVVATYDGRGGSAASDGINIYVNGVNKTDATFNAGSYTAMHNTTSDVKIGSYSSGVFANGNIDETAIFSSELTSENVTSIYNSGIPTTLPVTPVAHWKMGEQATFSTNWTIPDGVGSSDGTSANMTIEDRVGNASGSTLNGISFNMTESDREEDTPS